MAMWSVREMMPADLDAAIRIWERSRQDSIEPVFPVAEVIASVVRGDPAVVAEAKGSIVGTACGIVEGHRAWICRVALDENWRGQGIGSALLVALEQGLTAAGVTRMSALLHEGEIGEEALTNQLFTGPISLQYFDRSESYGPSQASVVQELGGRVVPPKTWSELSGGRDTKVLLERTLISPLANTSLAEQHGLKPPGAAILFGPPGTGKTSLARGIAGRLGWPFIEVFPTQLGATPAEIASGIRHTFSQLRSVEHAVVFIDEVDEIASHRQELSAGQAITNELLKVIPTFRSMPGRLLICATNNVSRLDPAFVRTGRFDYLIPIGPPDFEARTEALRDGFERMPHDDFDLESLAARLEGYTMADLDHLIRRAAQRSFERALGDGQTSRVSIDDVAAALEGTKPSVSPSDLEALAGDIEQFARF